MGSTRALLLAGAVALGVATVAHAADMPLPPPPAYFPPPPEPIAFGGWYLRGDVGAGIAMQDSISSSFDDGMRPQDFAVLHHTLEDDLTVGGGVGYQFNNWFRFDVTGEYRTPQQFRSIESYSLFDSTGVAVKGENGYDYYKGKVQSSVFLANAAIDLGSWYNVTPYITGGVGAAYTVVSGLTDLGLGGFPIDTFNNGYDGHGVAPSHGTWSLAWTAGAGISYSLTQNLKLDIGYRYLDMGDARSGPIACDVGGGCPHERQKYHLASSDIRVGLRWMFNDYAPLPQPELPIIRKD